MRTTFSRVGTQRGAFASHLTAGLFLQHNNRWYFELRPGTTRNSWTTSVNICTCSARTEILADSAYSLYCLPKRLSSLQNGCRCVVTAWLWTWLSRVLPRLPTSAPCPLLWRETIFHGLSGRVSTRLQRCHHTNVWYVPTHKLSGSEHFRYIWANNFSRVNWGDKDKRM